ncbi:MAG TPA: ABC transporter permease, partial [Phenylobacterium sp.]
MSRIFLIAGREFAAYTSAASFWVALLLGPVLMLLGATISAEVLKPQPAQTVSIEAADPALANAAARRLSSAGAATTVVVPRQAQARTRLLITSSEKGAHLEVRGEPLPAATVDALRNDLLADLRARSLRKAGAPAAALEAADKLTVEMAASEISQDAKPDAALFSRFAVTLVLWLNLAGALGMLLQAIVRERANRALEGLLAAARAQELVMGKLLGVSLISLLVLACWLGCGAALAATPFGNASAGVAGMLLSGFADPAALIQAGIIYLAAFCMYGAAIIGVGALARDVASAQNLARPVFGVLLLVFFATLGQLMSPSNGPGWLLWAPPFTPFL